jgi:putative peptidoglycan lipid II flippase
MSRRLATGDGRGAALAQARGIQLALLLTVPCAAASIAMPDLIMRALFARGAFTSADAAAAGATLAAYAVGLLPFVMLRSFTAPFFARGDTLTPVKAALLAATVNIALKIALMEWLAQVGLAFATSVGAWINLMLLWFFARRQGFAVSGAGLRPVLKLFGAGAVLGIALYCGELAITYALAGMSLFRDETALALLIVLGGVIYAAVVLLLLGRNWLRDLVKDVGGVDDSVSPPKHGPTLSDRAGTTAADVTKETSPGCEAILESV